MTDENNKSQSVSSITPTREEVLSDLQQGLTRNTSFRIPLSLYKRCQEYRGFVIQSTGEDYSLADLFIEACIYFLDNGGDARFRENTEKVKAYFSMYENVPGDTQ